MSAIHGPWANLLARKIPRRSRWWIGCIFILAGMASPVIASDLSLVEQIRLAAETRLKAQWPGQDLLLEITEPDPRLHLSSCEVPLVAQPLRPGPIQSAITLSVSCAAPKPWRVYVPVRVSAMGDVLVASRALPAGTVLAAEDVVVARRQITDLSYGYLQRAEAGVGSILRRPVAEGAVILPSLLTQPMAVRRGQQVLIEAVQGPIRVQGAGEMLADGATGTRVKVRNLASGRVVEGLVQVDGRIRVDF